jgi:lysozyme
MMKLSKTGADLIKKYEGCRLTAYLCPANVWTIGWGHTGNVKKGQTITQVQADTFFDKDIQRFVDGVNDIVKVEINQNQFDALVSFTYNCGVDALRKSSLAKYLNAKQFDKASAEFDRWNKGGGEVLKGLINRRKEERTLFDKQIPAAIKPTTGNELAYIKTGSMPIKEAEKRADEIKQRYGGVVHIMKA